MTNCVHPVVLMEALEFGPNKTDLVKERFRGYRLILHLSPKNSIRAWNLKHQIKSV